MENIVYESVVGSLVYAIIDTQAKITYALKVGSQYLTNLQSLH